MNGLRLGVNIDHVATLRQARYATMPESKNAEPDPVVAARMCERAGAQGIVAHLRADRRHIQDRDIERLRQNIMTKLNLEMGNTPEIVDSALRIVPDEVCLVPEKRRKSPPKAAWTSLRTARNSIRPSNASISPASGLVFLSIPLWNRWMLRRSSAWKWWNSTPAAWPTLLPKRSKRKNWKSCAPRRAPLQSRTCRSMPVTASITGTLRSSSRSRV